MAYKETKFDKGGAKAVFDGFNDNILPKGFKKKSEPKQLKQEPGSKKRKIH